VTPAGAGADPGAGDPLGLLPGCALHRLDADDWEHVLRALAGRVVAQGYARPSLVDAVVERERRFPTGLPTAVPSAIPHTDPEHVLRSGLAVATLATPVRFGVLATEVVMLLCVSDAGGQVAALQQVLAALRDGVAVARLAVHPDPATFEDAVRSWLGPESASAAGSR
jgi:PTS system galactitol-specific IIA component